MKELLTFCRRHLVVIIILFVFIICTIIYLYLQDQPGTNNAFVIAKIRPVSSRVKGFVSKIYVKNNQFVKKGAELFQLNQQPYRLAQQQALDDLNQAKQNLITLGIELKKDQQGFKEKQLAYQTLQFNVKNAKTLSAKKVYPKAKLKNMIRTMKIAQAELNNARLNNKIGQSKLKAEQLNIASLQTNYQQATLKLSYTKVYALTQGTISNLNLAPGTFVEPGKALFAFIDTSHWWIQANIKETQLNKVKPNQKVIIKLSLYPDHRFHGRVANIHWAVQRQKTAADSHLPLVAKENQWFLLPQRFPVLIKISDPNAKQYPLHVGASATVEIIN